MLFRHVSTYAASHCELLGTSSVSAPSSPGTWHNMAQPTAQPMAAGLDALDALDAHVTMMHMLC